MSAVVHQRQPGEFEIRIRPNGQVVLIAPDENLMAVAKSLAAPPTAANLYPPEIPPHVHQADERHD